MSVDLETLLSRAEALDKAATPGPWEATHRDCGYAATDDESGAGLGLDIDAIPQPQLRGMYRRAADAAFIAEARTLLPQMARMLRNLLTVIDERDAIYAEMGNPAGSPFPNLIPIMDVRSALTPDADGDGGG